MKAVAVVLVLSIFVSATLAQQDLMSRYLLMNMMRGGQGAGGAPGAPGASPAGAAGGNPLMALFGGGGAAGGGMRGGLGMMALGGGLSGKIQFYSFFSKSLQCNRENNISDACSNVKLRGF